MSWFSSGVDFVKGGIGAIAKNFDITGARGRDAAIKAQQEGTTKANQTLQDTWMEARNHLTPYEVLGNMGINGLYDPSFKQQFDASQMYKDPGYQFRMQQGQNAVNGSAAAKGALNSGATLKALTRYGQDYGAQEYNNAYSRFMDNQNTRWGRMSQLAGMGQNAANTQAQLVSNYGQGVSNNYMGMANAVGAANIAASNQQGQMFGNLINAGARAYGARAYGAGG